MEYPSWQDVGIPISLVKHIKDMGASQVLDALVHQVVFRNKRKTYFDYICASCGYTYKSPKTSEEINTCRKCGWHVITQLPIPRWGIDVPSYCRRFDLLKVINMMHENHFQRFDTKKDFDCGWGARMTHVTFPGGDKVILPNIRLTIIKAAILCPYLWESIDHLSSLLNTLHWRPQ